MDKTTAAVTAIKLINRTAEDSSKRPSMIKAVCAYFDLMKGKQLSYADKLFLHYLSNKAGVPQYYYPMLDIGSDVDEEISLQTFSNYVQESSYVVGDGVMLHRYQKEILDCYEQERRNRYFLSAATSFGKTFLIYEIIRKMQYQNVALILPTISLLSENLFKIHLSEEYKWVKENYKIHTLSDVTELEERNLFIYTPERFLSFADKNDGVNLDFVFVDEVYKLDNGFIIDEVQQENERDVAYRIALHELLKEDNTDALLAGPYIVLLADAERNESSFRAFLDRYGFSVKDYNKYDIVNKEEIAIKSASVVKVDDTFKLEFEKKSGKKARFIQLVAQLIRRNENTIVYCSQKAITESYAKELLDADAGLANENNERLLMLTNHIDNLFADGKGKQWIVSKALKKGIGIHHGLIPKYIQQEIISLFNKGILKVLICTTTITEGVNTTAKNIIVLSGKKGNKALKKFDAQNIEGRAGRFLKHYTGRVFIMDNDFSKCLKEADEPLQHKLFDKNVDKKDVDIVITGREYLSQAQEDRRNELDQQRVNSRMPQACFDAFRTISYEDKLFLYDMISRFSDADRSNIRELIRRFSVLHRPYYPGLELICQSVRSIIKNEKLRFYFGKGSEQRNNCYMVDMISAFISKGFAGSANYYIKKEEDVDTGIRKAAEFVFNMLRYQVVKYFGLFNLIYKHFEAVRTGSDVNNITGIESLLLRLEYSADTQLGRRASDIGASFRVVKYYDFKEQQGDNVEAMARSYNKLDDFEKYNVSNIDKIL